MTNVLLTILVLVLGGLAVAFLYWRALNEKSDDPERDKMTFNKMLDRVKAELSDLVKDETFYGVAGADFEAAYKRKARIVKAMRNCTYGFESDKIIVQGLIKNIVSSICETEEELCEIIDFYAAFLEPRIKFEILMYFYKKEHGKNALTAMIREYDLDRLRFEIEDKTQGSYLITSDDISMIYDEKNFQLDVNSMLDIITILIYQRYKGFGIIDTVREMNVNGLNAGASGSVLASILAQGRGEIMTAPRSVWLHYEGKQIHLRFLTFGNEEELRRIVQLVGRYGKSQPLTEKLGYKVSTMYDKSRVLSMRPPASEYWCMFIRKFTLPEVNLNFLLNPKDRTTGEALVKNPELPAELIRHIMLGQLTTVITGRQGTGKTTNMMAWVKYIDPRLTLRILEMVFELYLRELYPERNIISVQETEYVTPQALQDALKKSDGQVTLIGEIATDIVASRFIQNTQISSPFSIASHHGMTAKTMLQGLGNSHSSASGIPSAIALQQVVDAVPMNAHLNIRYDGVRYFERFTEIIPIIKEDSYPVINKGSIQSILASHAEVQREFAARQTQKDIFELNDILSFDVERGLYIPKNWFTDARTVHLLDRMTAEGREDMARFADKHWGGDSSSRYMS